MVFYPIFMIHKWILIGIHNEVKCYKSMNKKLFIAPIHFQIYFQITTIQKALTLPELLSLIPDSTIFSD